jgi:hypothetical protein
MKNLKDLIEFSNIPRDFSKYLIIIIKMVIIKNLCVNLKKKLKKKDIILVKKKDVNF